MLYDPKWEVTVKSPSLEDFISWASRFDPDQTYSYDCYQGGCLYWLYIAKFGATPRTERTIGPDRFRDFRLAFFRNVAGKRPWTFGAAVERARDKASHS
jgi:hypothetical protein